MQRVCCIVALLLQSLLSVAQNTGIGTTTPVEKLEVNGAIKIGNSTGNNPGSVRYNNGSFQGRNDFLWDLLGVPRHTLITVADTAGILGYGYSIYAKQTISIQPNFGSYPGRWLNQVFASSGVPFAFQAGTWTGSEIMVYYNNHIYRLNPSAPSWTQSVLNTVPGFVSRIDYSAVWTGTEMIIFGGVNGLTALNDGVKYNPTTDKWTAIANSPVHRFGHSAIMNGNEMIVFGGDSVSSSTGCTGPGFSSNQIWKYNIVSNTWTGPIAVTGTVPSPRRDHVAVNAGSQMLVYGGSRTFDGTCSSSVNYLGETYSFDFATNVWTQKSSTQPYQSVVGVWDGAKLFTWCTTVIGGIGYNVGQQFDPVGNSWTFFPNEAAVYGAGNGIGVMTADGFTIVESSGFQVFDSKFESSNFFYLPGNQTFYILRKE